jgi:hypothetical protein
MTLPKEFEEKLKIRYRAAHPKIFGEKLKTELLMSPLGVKGLMRVAV